MSYQGYPDQSNFRDSYRTAGWWYYRGSFSGGAYDPSDPTICATSAFSLLSDAQMVAREFVRSAGGQLLGYGTVVHADQVPQGALDGWSSSFLQVLYAIAKVNVDRTLIGASEVLAEDLRNHRVSTTAVRIAIWLAYHATSDRVQQRGGGFVEEIYGTGTPVNVVIPGNAVLPYYGFTPSTPPTPTSGSICKRRSAWYQDAAQRYRSIHPAINVVAAAGVMGAGWLALRKGLLV